MTPRIDTTLYRTRWPLEPLLAYAAARAERYQHPIGLAGNCARCPYCYSAKNLAAEVGVTSRSAERWRSAGLTDEMADRCATALGAHPSAIWSDWFTVVAA